MQNRRTRFGIVAIVALALPIFMSSIAIAIGDGTDPDNTYAPDGRTCSTTAITPTGSGYHTTINGYDYALRYSTGCRSVWTRSSNSAPLRSQIVTHRITDSSAQGYCTRSVQFTGATYTWTAQVNDINHYSNSRLSSSHDCVNSHASWISNKY